MNFYHDKNLIDILIENCGLKIISITNKSIKNLLYLSYDIKIKNQIVNNNIHL